MAYLLIWNLYGIGIYSSTFWPRCQIYKSGNTNTELWWSNTVNDHLVYHKYAQFGRTCVILGTAKTGFVYSCTAMCLLFKAIIVLPFCHVWPKEPSILLSFWFSISFHENKHEQSSGHFTLSWQRPTFFSFMTSFIWTLRPSNKYEVSCLFSSELLSKKRSKMQGILPKTYFNSSSNLFRFAEFFTFTFLSYTRHQGVYKSSEFNQSWYYSIYDREQSLKGLKKKPCY